MISNAMSIAMYEHDGIEGNSRTELNWYANMVFVGNHATILFDAGNKVYVSPLTIDYQAMNTVMVWET